MRIRIVGIFFARSVCKFDGRKTDLQAAREFSPDRRYAPGREGIDDRGWVVVQAPET